MQTKAAMHLKNAADAARDEGLPEIEELILATRDALGELSRGSFLEPDDIRAALDRLDQASRDTAIALEAHLEWLGEPR